MIPIKIMKQPDDVSCGPTSLHSVYSFYKDKLTLEEVIKQVAYLKDGGTLAVYLGIHALERGYTTTVYTYNLELFDPTWFQSEAKELSEKLKIQLKYKKSKKFLEASRAYIKFLKLGGRLKFENLTIALLRRYFKKNIPILVGLSATYLYQCSREYTNKKKCAVYDDLKGYPTGHFVVLCGYDKTKRDIIVADPYGANPIADNHYYTVEASRLINAILLGIVTYDANLLIIEPKGTQNA